jgi:hypothetical protein
MEPSSVSRFSHVNLPFLLLFGVIARDNYYALGATHFGRCALPQPMGLSCFASAPIVLLCWLKAPGGYRIAQPVHSGDGLSPRLMISLAAFSHAYQTALCHSAHLVCLSEDALHCSVTSMFSGFVNDWSNCRLSNALRLLSAIDPYREHLR